MVEDVGEGESRIRSVDQRKPEDPETESNRKLVDADGQAQIYDGQAFGSGQQLQPCLVLERYGLGGQDLRRENPGLIYCSLSGYGQTGPYRSTKAYDLLIQGEAGIIATTGYPDAPAKVGVPIADLAGGSNAALAVLMALLERARTGQGVYLDIAMFDAVLNWLGYFPQYWWHTGEELPRSGMRQHFICPYGPYLASDGRYINLAVASEQDWQRFCREVVQKPEWLDDPRFQSVDDRRRHRDVLDPAVEAVIASEPQDVWMQRLAEAGLPYGQVRSISEGVNHPQLRERQLVVDASSPFGNLPVIRFPLASGGKARRIPELGENTDQILQELGYDGPAIEALRQGSVI